MTLTRVAGCADCGPVRDVQVDLAIGVGGIVALLSINIPTLVRCWRAGHRVVAPAPFVRLVQMAGERVARASRASDDAAWARFEEMLRRGPRQ